MAEQAKPEAPRAPAPQPIDESKVDSQYANFFRVTNTGEELIVDFGLNAATVESQHIPVVLGQRVVLNHFTAKRLFQALGLTLERHEKTFGIVETNVQRRLLPSAPQAPARPNT